MSLNVPLLRQSFQLVVERQPAVVSRFYDILFQRYPQAQPLFGRNARAKQEEMLTGALVAVMDHLDDAPWFHDTLSALGEKHRDYGVTPMMFDWVGESLLATLAEIAGADWTPEMERQWTMAYGAIAQTMQSAMARKAA